MNVSARWINDYLEPPASPEEQAELLTRVGFPLEHSELLEDGDRRQDFEMTSNRGDCLCHVGLAREIAAVSGRMLKAPVMKTPSNLGPPAAKLIRVTNREPDLCPYYSARVIRGVTVAPSPQWLQERLIARGDIPRNNIVDATNFVLFELGQPTHVFDLAALEGPEIVIRRAAKDEPFLPIGEGAREIRLDPQDLVIADARVPVALAGVKGGAPSAVSASTRDIVIESATFDPATVRQASRRHGIESDSCYRFERGVHAGQVNPAAERLVQLVLELAGGELADGVVADGAPLPAPVCVDMRCPRCRALLGVEISDDEMVSALGRLGFEPSRKGERICCTVPVHRLDIQREIDLIEEVGRMYGHERIPIEERPRPLILAPPQHRELAKQAVQEALVGMGFVETITPSLIGEEAAAAFLRPGTEVLRVADARARLEPALRPSLLPSLLRVRAHNARQRVGELRLFESAATFCRVGTVSREETHLGLIVDGNPPQSGLRLIRGVLDRLARLLLGPDASMDVTPDDTLPWLAPGALVTIAGEAVGHLGVIAPAALKRFDLDEPIVAAELGLSRFYDGYPPETEAHALPSFPAIERDVSVIVGEQVPWAALAGTAQSQQPELMEAIEFVTVFRGKPIPPRHKSVTLRCRFRAPDRTLTHDEVDPQMALVVRALEREHGAEIRS